MPMELHHLNDEVPGSSPGGSNMWGHSSMVEHEVSSKPCRRNLVPVMENEWFCSIERRWRRGQDSNLHILSDGGFQDRCTTIMRPLRNLSLKLYRRLSYGSTETLRNRARSPRASERQP